MTEPISRFTSRAHAVVEALSFTGIVPEAVPAMVAKDGALNERMDALDAEVAGPTVEAITEAARKWAGRRNSTAAPVLELLGAPSSAVVPSRYATFRRAAIAELVRAADKAHPEWSSAALVESVRDDVAAWFTAAAVEAVEAVKALPTAGRAHVDRGGSPLHVENLVDSKATPVEHIAAYRRCAAAWSKLELIGVDQATAHDRLVYLLANGEPGKPAESTGTVAGVTFARHRNGWNERTAVWLDAEGMSSYALGMPLAKVILAGRGTLQPLADPFGADNAEFEARLDAAKAAVSWLAERVRDHSRGMGPESAHAIANGNPDRFSRAGFVNGAAARAAFDAAGVWAAA